MNNHQNLLVLLCFILYSCQFERDKLKKDIEYPVHPNYTLYAEQTGFEQEVGRRDTLSLFGVKLWMVGKYDTLPPIYYMTCSWGTDCGLTNDERYGVGYHPCDANFWMFSQVTITDTLFLETVVIRKGKFEDFINKEIRIGFQAVDTVELSWNAYFNIEDHIDSSDWESQYETLGQAKERIVRSNPINLKKLNTKIDHGGHAWMSSMNR